VVLSPDGKTAYVSNEEIAHASAIDIKSGKTLFSTPVGVEPEGVGITRDGRKLYVTAETNSTVSVIDAKTGRLLKTLHVGDNPRTVAFTPTAPAPGCRPRRVGTSPSSTSPPTAWSHNSRSATARPSRCASRSARMAGSPT